ncbi:hypothetical protein B0H14DRAFT_3893832 [Mycena olivaceomarginata]|nr:hypothetical protein B0H14DRAFT_3893832 [Mycena olivaceomarginata]
MSEFATAFFYTSCVSDEDCPRQRSTGLLVSLELQWAALVRLLAVSLDAVYLLLRKAFTIVKQAQAPGVSQDGVEPSTSLIVHEGPHPRSTDLIVALALQWAARVQFVAMSCPVVSALLADVDDSESTSSSAAVYSIPGELIGEAPVVGLLYFPLLAFCCFNARLAHRSPCCAPRLSFIPRLAWRVAGDQDDDSENIKEADQEAEATFISASQSALTVSYTCDPRIAGFMTPAHLPSPQAPAKYSMLVLQKAAAALAPRRHQCELPHQHLARQQEAAVCLAALTLLPPIADAVAGRTRRGARRTKLSPPSPYCGAAFYGTRNIAPCTLAGARPRRNPAFPNNTAGGAINLTTCTLYLPELPICIGTESARELRDTVGCAGAPAARGDNAKIKDHGCTSKLAGKRACLVHA